MRKNFIHNLNKITLLTVFILIYQFLSSLVYGQAGGVAPGETVTTNPKLRSNVVTASVPDIVAPTAPFLILPEDESLLNDATPNFVWQQSTDNVGISYYELYIDGSLKFGSIPISDIENSEYTLIYDSGSGKYTLTPKDTISNGSHNWYVKVYDAAGNFNTSATWDFVIDTNAPSFIITAIGPLTTTISAQDIDSIPEDPIELEDNQPEFVGTGENNSTVQVTVQIPGESNQIINFTIDSSGNWDFQLGILPRDEVITLSFIITDEAGNVSVLTDLKILIIQEFIIFPPTPTPSPTPTITPEPTGSPIATTSASPTPISTPPGTPLPTPIIKIPVLPPEEIAEVIKDEIIEIIPEPIIEVAELVPETIRTSIKETVDSIAPIGVLVTTAAIPAIGFLSLLLQLGQQFSWGIILKILQALGLIPPKKPQGMVFDSQTNEPIAFALLTITSINELTSEKLVETVVTDVNGIYQGVQLPVGKYFILVNHQDYTFPTLKDRPGYLSIQEFYKGEEFEVTSGKRQQLFLIPVDKKTKSKEKFSIKKTIRGIIKKMSFTDLFWPLFIFSILVTLFYPTMVNFIMLSFYFLMLIKRSINTFKKPTISGFVKNQQGMPEHNATVRISNPSKGELVAIINTNKHGYYEAFLEPDKYQIQITKTGSVWIREGSQLSFEEVDVTQGTKIVDVTMSDLQDIYKELFSINA